MTSAGSRSGDGPPAALLRVLEGFWLARALAVVAELGIPDLLKAVPQSAGELAAATGTHPDALRRVLRALAGAGVLRQDEQGRFATAPAAAALESGAADSLRAFFLEELDGEHQRAWGELLHSVRTGRTAFEHVFGTDLWSYRDRHPEDARSFDAAMADLTAAVAGALVAAWDFSRFRTIVDVGGGDAGLLAAILGATPGSTGVLLELPRAIPAARRRIEAAGLAGRCAFVAGDFFSAVPPGDLLVLKSVVHDWDDERARAILRACRRSLAGGGRLLLVEAPLPPPNRPSFHAFMDLNMLVMTGGRERTEAEYRGLLEASGFALSRVVPLRLEVCAFEAVPRFPGG